MRSETGSKSIPKKAPAGVTNVLPLTGVAAPVAGLMAKTRLTAPAVPIPYN